MTDPNSHGDARSSRRALIKRTAAVTAAAWVAPAIIDSITNPAAAATCAHGTYYVAYAGTGGTTNGIAAITPVANSCSVSGTNVAPATFGLTAVFQTTLSGSFQTVAHQAAAPGNVDQLQIKITNGCSCRITAVVALVHLMGPGGCPDPACITATTATTNPLVIVAGAINTKSVTVQPSDTTPSACSTAIHWGQPASGGSASPTNMNSGNGYLLVQVTCP